MNDDSIYNRRFDDSYFSRDDGLGETHHVYIEGNDLPKRWQDRKRFTIGELGFGTGLNFLATWRLFDDNAARNRQLDYIAVEGYPLSADEIEAALAPWYETLGAYCARLCESWPPRVPGWHRIDLSKHVRLTLIFDDVQDGLEQLSVPLGVDCWYPDGFNPAHNPDMWSHAVFQAMAQLSAPGATFATYTAAGFVRRGLETAGFTVEKRPGFGAKRHMLSGRLKEV